MDDEIGTGQGNKYMIMRESIIAEEVGGKGEDERSKEEDTERGNTSSEGKRSRAGCKKREELDNGKR